MNQIETLGLEAQEFRKYRFKFEYLEHNRKARQKELGKHERGTNQVHRHKSKTVRHLDSNLNYLLGS